jgi:hypothetical protein
MSGKGTAIAPKNKEWRCFMDKKRPEMKTSKRNVQRERRRERDEKTTSRSGSRGDILEGGEGREETLAHHPHSQIDESGAPI